MTSCQFGPSHVAFISQFSVPHAIKFVPQLKQLINSRDAQSRRVADHLLKTSSILLFLSNKGTPYQQVLRKHEMAWAE